jgi:hypothetical protein
MMLASTVIDLPRAVCWCSRCPHKDDDEKEENGNGIDNEWKQKEESEV